MDFLVPNGHEIINSNIKFYFIFCLKILFNVNGKATMWHTPFFYDVLSRHNKFLMSLTSIYLIVVKFLHIFTKLKYGSRGKKRNPSLGLVTKARGLQGCEQRGRPESHITCSRECKECEGMNLHTPKWTPRRFPNLQNAIAGVKTH
jgi:hypothetical protein